tara:strand:- start:13491 stop:13697 length:207 start_codon:yes stop_codon:yes gene_type:complete
MDMLLGIFALGFFMVLISGAYLLLEDSEKLFHISKDLKKKNPKMSRLEIKQLARKKFNQEVKEENNVK